MGSAAPWGAGEDQYVLGGHSCGVCEGLPCLSHGRMETRKSPCFAFGVKQQRVLIHRSLFVPCK